MLMEKSELLKKSEEALAKSIKDEADLDSFAQKYFKENPMDSAHLDEIDAVELAQQKKKSA
jgi:hypothetical protein